MHTDISAHQAVSASHPFHSLPAEFSLALLLTRMWVLAHLPLLFLLTLGLSSTLHADLLSSLWVLLSSISLTLTSLLFCVCSPACKCLSLLVPFAICLLHSVSACQDLSAAPCSHHQVVSATHCSSYLLPANLYLSFLLPVCECHPLFIPFILSTYKI